MEGEFRAFTAVRYKRRTVICEQLLLTGSVISGMELLLPAVVSTSNNRELANNTAKTTSCFYGSSYLNEIIDSWAIGTHAGFDAYNPNWACSNHSCTRLDLITNWC